MTVRNDEDHRKKLRAKFRAGKTKKFLLFWGHTASDDAPGTWCLSQWWRAPFHEGGDRYATAEHFMMAEKARLFGDEEVRSEILDAGSPKQAKALGRKVRGFDEEVWRQHRFDIVVRGNLTKFRENADLGTFLINTGNKVLVEASPHDRVWGIGLAAENRSALNPLEWRGLNLLGFALMEVRKTLRG